MEQRRLSKEDLGQIAEVIRVLAETAKRGGESPLGYLLDTAAVEAETRARSDEVKP